MTMKSHKSDAQLYAEKHEELWNEPLFPNIGSVKQ